MPLDYRLSYYQSNEESHKNEYSYLINPCKNLVDEFNSFEEIQNKLKVYLRIKPLLYEESLTAQDGDIEIESNKLKVTAPTGSHAFKNKPKGTHKLCHHFKFTRIYDQSTSQKSIFEDTTLPLVNDLITGQSGLLFTYGATNSGKTYTVQGTSLNVGLLPRALDHLFKAIGGKQYPENDLMVRHLCNIVRLPEKQAKEEEEFRADLLQMGSSSLCSLSQSNCSLDSLGSRLTTGLQHSPDSMSDIGGEQIITTSDTDIGASVNADCVYAVFISLAEVYNEYVFDLLQRRTSQNRRSPLTLGEDQNGSIYIKGLKEVRVKNVDEALRILEVGKQNLHFASTQLNHNSSRSHCIFTVKLAQFSNLRCPNIAKMSILTICDLAGAERTMKAALNTTDRLREANNINTSLLVLGRCISALMQNQILKRQAGGVASKKSVVVPYRESKVTRIFQSFFMGEGQISMIVNISLSSKLFDETLKVLKFSALAREVTILQEKPHNAHSFLKPSANRFSKIIRQSLNASQASSRMSVPWATGVYPDLTFGEEGAKSTNLGEEETIDEEDEEEEEDPNVQILLDTITKLKDKLLQVSKEKAEVEVNLRKELCDAFSKRIVKIEENWENRLNDECARKDELMECRLRNMVADLRGPSRKRPRADHYLEDDDEGELNQDLVPSVLLVKQETKTKLIEKERDELQEEMEVVKESLAATSKSLKSAREEVSRLVFHSANNERILKETINQKEALENSLKNITADESKQGLNSVILEELQLKCKQFESEKKAKENEIKQLKTMLLKAADELSAKEEQNKQLEEEKSLQSLIVSDLEAQLAEAKDMEARQRAYFESRERELDELRAQVKNDKMDNQLEKIQAEPQINETSKSHDLFETSRSNELQYRIDELESELSELQQKNANLEKRNKDLTRDITTWQKESSAFLQENQELIKSIDELKQNHESVLQENEELLDKMRQKTVAMNSDNLEERLGYQLKDMQKQIIDKEEEIEKLMKEHKKILEDNRNFTADNDFLMSELESKKQNEKQMTKRVFELNDKISQLENKLKSVQNVDTELKSNMDEKNENISNLKSNLDAKDKQLLENMSKIKELENGLIQANENLAFMKTIVTEKSTVVENMNRIAVDKDQNFANKVKELADSVEEGNMLKERVAELEKNLRGFDVLENKLKDLTCENKGLLDKITNLEECLNKAHNKNNEDIKAKETEMKEAIKEKESVIHAISSKLRTLDLNMDDTETKCEVLKKENAALQEARSEEANIQKKKMEERDREIESLQLELKRIMQSSLAFSLDRTGPAENRTESVSSKSNRSRDTFSDDIERNEQDIPTGKENSKTRKRLTTSHTKKVDSASEVSVHVEPRPWRGRVTRSGRATARVASKESYCEDSAGRSESEHSASRQTRNSAKKQTIKPALLKTSASIRKPRRGIKFCDTTEDFEDDLEVSKDEDYVPSQSKKSTSTSKSKSRGKSRKNSRSVFNPHLENSENIDVSTLSHVGKDTSIASKDKSPPRTRSSRRRPLYSMNEDPLNQSPDILSNCLNPSVIEPSPHSVVKRKLKTKT